MPAFFFLSTWCSFISVNAQQLNLEWAAQFDTQSMITSVDPNGNIIVTGSFEGTADFDPGPGVQNMTASYEGYTDGFIVKLNSNGTFRWARQVSALEQQGPPPMYSVVLSSVQWDATGNILVSGISYVPATFDSANPAASTPAGVFVARYEPQGAFADVKWLFNTSWLSSVALTKLGTDGSMYISGYYRGTVDFDPSAGSSYYLTSDYNGTVSTPFLLILDAAKNFQKVISWPGMSTGFDNLGNIFVSGSLSVTTDFDPGPTIFNLSPTYNLKGYLVKLTSSGDLVWAKRTGTPGTVTVDADGNIYRCGQYAGTVDFNDADEDLFNLTASGSEGSVFVQKLTNNGDFVWAKSTAGSGQLNFGGLTIASNGTLYLSMGTYGNNPVDLDLNPAKEYLFTPTAYTTNFLCKLTSAGELESVFSMETAASLRVIFTSDNDHILISSMFRENLNISLNPWNSYELNFQGDPEKNVYKSNWFLAKYNTNTTICPSGILQVSKMAQLKFPAGCTQFNGSLTIIGSEITSLDGLSHIEGVTGDLIISSTGLQNLTGLGALQSVGGTFEISSNSVLTSLAGLASGEPANGRQAARKSAITSIQSLIIRNNPVLTDCAVKFVADHLSAVASTSEIANNGENGQCNTAADIIDAWQTALPVTLTAFSVTSEENHTAQIFWTTISESNSSHFEVEHSEDAKNWITIGQKSSQGESSKLNYYNYTHTSPSPYANYYRLKLVDLDGTFSYSKIQTLQLREIGSSIYPNPVSHKLTIAPEKLSLLTRVQMINAMGIEVPVKMDVRRGTLDVSGLSAGFYLIRLSSKNGATELIKVVVKP